MVFVVPCLPQEWVVVKTRHDSGTPPCHLSQHAFLVLLDAHLDPLLQPCFRQRHCHQHPSRADIITAMTSSMRYSQRTAVAVYAHRLSSHARSQMSASSSRSHASPVDAVNWMTHRDQETGGPGDGCYGGAFSHCYAHARLTQ